MQRININLMPSYIREKLLQKKNPAYLAGLSAPKSTVENETDKNLDLETKFLAMQTSSLHRLKKLDINYNNCAPSQLHCDCIVCKAQGERHKTENKEEPQEKFFDDYDLERDLKNADTEKDFVFILKKLMPAKNLTTTLRINVPDTVAFVGGQPKFKVTTGEDNTLKFVRQKEKLTFQELNKFFQARFRKCQAESTLPDENDANVPIQKKITLTETESGSVFGYDKETSKEQKKLSMKSFITKEQLIKNEVALAKFYDNSTKTVSEAEFEHIITKRKCDSFWKTLQYLQVFTRTKTVVQTFKRVNFSAEREKDHTNFQRARKEILALNNEDSASEGDFFSLSAEEEFEEKLLQTDENEYYIYILMKIYHFLDVIHGIKIIKMSGEFVREKTTAWLMNISRLQYTQPPVNQKGDIATQMVEWLSPEQSKRINGVLKTYFINLERLQAIKILNNVLRQYYKYKKASLGNLPCEYYYGDDISDEIFSKIHPNAPFKLSDMVRTDFPYPKIVEFIQNNAETLKKFQQYMYDGQDTKMPVKKLIPKERESLLLEAKSASQTKKNSRLLAPLGRMVTKQDEINEDSSKSTIKSSKRSISVQKIRKGDDPAIDETNLPLKPVKVIQKPSDQYRRENNSITESTQIQSITAREKVLNESNTQNQDFSNNLSRLAKISPYETKLKRSKSFNNIGSDSNQLSVLDSSRFTDLQNKVRDRNTTSDYTRYLVSNSLPFLLTLKTKAFQEKFLIQ